jgi:DNA modification methylase
MKTERVPIDSVKLDPANVRRHGEKNLSAIKSSLSRFGQQKPIVVDADGIVRAGNGTWTAAKALGWKEITVVRTDLKGSEATAYAIADNRTGELAEWDDDALAQTLAALQIEDEELALDTGFDAKEIDALLAPDEVTEDEVPEPPADPITKPGDLWILGEHRLLCGDSTKAEDVERLMAGAKAGMVFTDPPYGINFQSNFREQTPQFEKIANDDAILEIWPLLWSTMSSNSAAYVCTRWDVYHKWLESSNKFDVKNCVVWYKRGGGLGDLKNSYSPNHEFIIVAHKGTAALRGKRLADVWEVGRDAVTSYAHPTQKPVALPAIAVESHSDKGDVVLDLFLGSGTTLIAAEQLGRKCYGMEISPAYCDVIVQRWETLTGKKAKRAAR